MYKRKYSVNDNYFNKIDTEIKAYFVGILAADGCIRESQTEGKQPRHLQFKLSGECDRYLVEKMRDELCPDRPLNIENDGNPKHQTKYKLTVTSNQICADLLKCNLTPRKSLTLKFPENIPDNLIHHVICGYFDGDGTVGIFNRNKNWVPQYSVCIVGTKEFLMSINEILHLKADMPIQSITKYDTENNHRLNYCGNNNIKNFCNYIYKDATLFMERKNKRLMSVFDIIKLPHPNRKKINQIDPITNQIIKTWNGLSEASKMTNSSLSGISNVINKRAKIQNGKHYYSLTAGGFKWAYADEEEKK